MDKKVPVFIVGLFVLVAGGILAGFLVFMQPRSHESTVRVDSFHFPAGVPGAKQTQTGEGSEGTAQMMSESAPAAPAPPPGGSLGFLKKDANVVSGPGGAGGFGGGSKPSSDNPAELVNQFREDRGDVPDVEGGADKMSGNVTHALLKRVVDKVHRLQPKWYQEFLSYKDCKALADRYDKAKDFKGFVKDLHRSKSFHGMLKKYHKTKTMRGLTQSLMGDQSTGPQLLQLFGENARDPNMLAMVKTYGQDAGLPPAMVAQASNVAIGLQAVTQPSRQKAPPAMGNRPRLKSTGFGAGNFSSKQQQGNAGQGQLPQDIDPEMLKKVQQYLPQK
ncbi:MAG: hypothetical protein WC728_17140 [Elusimicrobiota bacterium]